MTDFDITLIGGGINGTAIARDAAGRGLRVLLLEKNDLGSGTSWASTKLIHGGLRYLEQYAFRMVQEGLKERAILLKMAPHIIWPAQFVLPHHKGLRPAWLLRLGLFVYDILAGNSMLPATRRLNLADDVAGKPLQPEYQTAFEYSDCRVDDARLVVLNAVDAAERGAVILTRAAFQGAVRNTQHWEVSYLTPQGQQKATSKILINASGPWIESVNALMPQDITRASVKLVKGSHIVVRRLFDHDKSYIFQNADGRIVFAIPYETDFTLIGTTEEKMSGAPDYASISDIEIDYLCKVANNYFCKPVSPQDVVWTFAGVRALYDTRSLSAKDLSRDYFLALDSGVNKPPLLSVYGGKLTAARHLAETVLEQLASFIPMGKSWTAHIPLPGGNFAWNSLNEQTEKTLAKWSFLSSSHARRLVRSYGTRTAQILDDATSMHDLGICFGADLTEREVNYLMQHEWAKTADDVLWLRSKLGLRFTTEQKEYLEKFMLGTAHE